LPLASIGVDRARRAYSHSIVSNQLMALKQKRKSSRASIKNRPGRPSQSLSFEFKGNFGGIEKFCFRRLSRSINQMLRFWPKAGVINLR
jgi:hypothetical protein